MYYIHVDKKTQEKTLKLVIHKDKLKQVVTPPRLKRMRKKKRQSGIYEYYS